MTIQLDENYYRMLTDLQAADFVLVELTLYLDTHPTDRAALQQFNDFSMKRQKLAYEFQLAYGPLTQFGQSGPPQNSWRWAQDPWPWQV
ncbi:spore coat protein CotJB [Paenibacillus lutrae]|uniref:Spore coat protein CotJB n=1 Tax=Paenibacillus lutrae TaxID=2078573 RepID=A0A7X3FK77_9BACL|nr:spore coat protein CotJB [Paenibacillus lutrae]MVP00857.1 spore coat protein CotJB [Paenibacillus lutrae]